MAQRLFVIIADGEVDQVCETFEDTAREMSDLRAMGCRVSNKRFDTWDEVNTFIDLFHQA